MISMDRYIGLLTVGADITQAAPERIGTAWNSLIARISNVKAGKFVASQEDMDSADYDENNFEALNDVEKVLDSIGIKLRENYGTWKDTEDIIEEIGKKWEKWDKTTQNAVATAVAGTRQREIFATTMANYDQVSKYERIAQNSYGTAQEKMKIYSDSLEAAQQRATNALEKFALELQNSDLLKLWYDTITVLIRNIGDASLALTAFVSILKAGDIVNLLTQGVTGLGVKFTNLGLTIEKIATGITASGGLQGAKQYVVDNINNSYLTQMQTYYATKLQQTGLSLDETTQANYIQLQNTILGSEKVGRRAMSELLLGDANSELYAQTITAILDEAKYSNIKQALINIDQQQYKERVQQLMNEQNLSRSEAELTAMIERLAQVKGSQAGKTVGQNINDFSKRGGANAGIPTAITGVGTLIGSMGGMFVGQSLGKEFFGEKGQIWGTMLGTTMGAYAGQSLLNGITAALHGRLTLSLSSIFPVAAIVALVAGGVVTALKVAKEKTIKAQSEMFQEASDKYQSMVESSVDTERFDELSKGVDKLGRNISLTDEEYKEFLKLNTSLAQAFPSTISYVNEQGQAFVTASKGVATYTETVENLIKQQQIAADKAMLQPELFESGFNDAYKQYEEVSKELDKNRKLLEDAKEENAFPIFNVSEQYASGREKYNESTGSVEQYDVVRVTVDGNSVEEITNNMIELQKHMEKFDLDWGNIQSITSDINTDISQGFEIPVDEFEKLKSGNFDEYLATLNSETVDLTLKTNESAKAFTDWNNALYRLLKNGQGFTQKIYDFDSEEIFGNISTEEEAFLQKMMSNFTPLLGETGQQYKERFAKTIQEYHDYFKSDGKNLLTWYMRLDDSQTGAQYENIRKEIGKELDNINKQSSEMAKKLADDLGYFWEDGHWKDKESVYTRMLDQIKKLKGEQATLKFSPDDFNNAFTREEQSIYMRMLTNGEANYNDDIPTIRRRLNAYNSANTDEFSARRNINRYTSFLNDKQWSGSISSKDGKVNDYSSELEAMFDKTMDWGQIFSAEDFMSTFPDLDKEIAQKFEQLSLSIKEGGMDSKEATTEAMGYVIDGIQDSVSKIAEIKIEELFPGVDIDGFADSWKEWGDMLAHTAKQLDAMEEAFIEQNTYGRLGWKTTLDLLSANERYAEALEVVDGKIRLKANAEDIMARIELQTTLMTMEATRAQKLLELQEAANTLALIEKGNKTQEVTDVQAQATQKNINNNEAESKSIAYLTALTVALGKAKLAVARGEDPGSISNAIKSATTAMNQVSINAKVDTSAISKTYSDTEVANLKAKVGNTVYTNSVTGQTVDKNKVHLEDGEFYQIVTEDAGNGFKRAKKQKVDVSSDMSGYGGQEIKLLDSLIGEAKGYLDSGEAIKRGGFYNLYDPSNKNKGSSGSGKDFTDELMRDLDTLKKLDELIDKEYENWLKWNDAIKTTTDSLNQATSSALDTAVAMGDFLKSDYYDKKRSSLDALIAATEAEKAEWESLAKNGKYYNFKGEQITTKEFLETSMDYEKQLIDLKKQRFNLDDEYYDDWLNTLKLQKDLIDGDEKRLGIYEDYNDYLAVDENYNKTKLANLQQQLKVAQEALYVAKVSDNQDEYLENLKRVRDLEDEITDLIYQQKKDRVDLLESIGVSYATLIEAQKQLLAYTYTQEDQIENQNKLIDLLKQERDLRLEINESNRKILEQAAKYYEGNAYTRPDKYDETVNRRDELLKADAELLWSEYQKAIARAQNILRQERDENGNQRYTETEINIKAAEDEDARNLLDKYLQTIEERGNLIVERFEKRIAQIDNAIKDLETTKPQEWGKLEDISPYWDKYVVLLQSKVAEIQEALKNTSGLTDAQINSLVDSYNEAVSALNEAARNKLEEITSYQQNQFSALEDWVGEYIDNLGKLKDLVSDYYDGLLPNLEKEIDDRQDNIKLLELEAQLLNAREKQRVNLLMCPL